MDKIKPLKKVVEAVNQLKQQGKSVALITGCFDIIHVGHIQLFRFAKSQADVVVVGLENDETIHRSKGGVDPYIVLNREV